MNVMRTGCTKNNGDKDKTLAFEPRGMPVLYLCGTANFPWSSQLLEMNT